MEYRSLGKTGLKASVISFGAEWLEGKSTEEAIELVSFCERKGINLLDCWMSEPKVRSDIGIAIKNSREKWIIQGHIGSTWQNNQYVRSRDMDKVIESFEDQMKRLNTDYLDFGMIHYVDDVSEFESIMDGEFFKYVKELKNKGIIHHIGLSTHNTDVALIATEYEEIELIMFSINPAYDMLQSMTLEETREENRFDDDLNGTDPKRDNFYRICDEKNIAITVMKGFAGGTLLKDETSPFGVALTPVQCIEYALSRPGVSSILVGVHNVSEMADCLKYKTATDKEKDYVSILLDAPYHSYEGQCTYCGHCSPCSSEINIAMVNKYYDLAKVHSQIPKSIQGHYDDLTFNASDCTYCEECEPRCPFNVKIACKMFEINKFFGEN